MPKRRSLAYRVLRLPKTFWFFRTYLRAVGDAHPNRAAGFDTRVMTFGRVTTAEVPDVGADVPGGGAI
jgi:hypothetical protein